MALPRLHPSLVLAATAEPLVSGARVAVLGDASLDLIGELAERGARLVHVYDADRVRLAEASARSTRRSVAYAPLPDDGDLGVRDGVFDLVVVPDLSFSDDPSAILALARRVMSRGGATLVASPNPEAAGHLVEVPTGSAPLGYYELYDAVTAHFARARMIGQAPFVGYAVAEFSVEGEPDVSIDTSLVEYGSQDPEWYLVLASERDVRLEPYTLVELPIKLALGRTPEPIVRPASEPLEAEIPVHASMRIQAADSKIASLEATIGALHAERDRAIAAQHAAEHRAVEEASRAERAALDSTRQTDLADRARIRTAELEAQTARLAKDASALSAELEHERRRRRELEREVQAAPPVTELDALRDRVAALEGELATERAKVAEAQRGLGAALESELVAERAKAAEARKELDDSLESRSAEVRELEARLVERADRVAALERDLLRTERTGRELVELLEEARDARVDGHGTPPAAAAESEAAVADLHARLDRLAAEAARREADLTAAQWKVAELERKLTAPSS